MRSCRLFSLLVGLSLSLTLITGVLSPLAMARSFVLPDVKQQQSGMLSRFYYSAALQLASQGGVDLAADFIGKVYRLNPQDLQLALFYASFCQLQGRYNEALSLYQEFLTSFQDPKAKATIYYKMAMLYDVMEQPQKSTETLQEAIRMFPDKAPAVFYYDLGVVYAKLQQFDKTMVYSQKALEQAPTSSEAWNNFGYSLAKMGQYQEGYSAVEKSLELNPENPNALDSKGYILFQMGRFKESVIEYEKAVQLDPKLADSFLFLGKSYEALQDWPKAMTAYENFLLLTTDDQEKADAAKRLEQLKLNALIHQDKPPSQPEEDKPDESSLKLMPDATLMMPVRSNAESESYE